MMATPTAAPLPHPFPLEEILTPSEVASLSPDIQGKLNQSIHELQDSLHNVRTQFQAEKVVYGEYIFIIFDITFHDLYWLTLNPLESHPQFSILMTLILVFPLPLLPFPLPNPPWHRQHPRLRVCKESMTRSPNLCPNFKATTQLYLTICKTRRQSYPRFKSQMMNCSNCWKRGMSKLGGCLMM